MMRHRKLYLILVLMSLVLVAPLHAQNEEGPLVVFIEGRAIDSSTVTNRGQIGTSALADIFRALGARVQQIAPTDSIPEDAQVAVLVRPLRTVRPAYIARLWAHLYRGGSVLLAFDPENFFLGGQNVNSRLSRSGLPELLRESYGIQIGEGVIIEPQYTQASLSNLANTYSLVYPDLVPNPVTDPLRAVGAPIWIWGARPVSALGLGYDSRSYPLLYTDVGYVESDPAIFPSNNPNAPPAVPFAFDTPADMIGRINIAAISENWLSGGRVAILGDSEMILNSFGLLQVNNRPVQVGNYVFAQRLAAWLLRLPEEEWPPLPREFTWLGIDGEPEDWLAYDTILNVTAAQMIGRGELRAVMDDAYFYAVVWPYAATDDTLTFLFDTNLDREADLTVVANATEVTIETPEGRSTITDAVMAIGEVIEFRLPRRYLPLNARLDTVYVGTAERPRTGELTTEVRTLSTVAISPLPRRASTLVTMVSTERVNLRTGPGTDFPVRAQVESGAVFEALGRSADGDWILVQNARHEGWIAEFLLLPNGSLQRLPVVES